ncbi:TIGR03557 family F420-dependent LLM class oxidoreductase [bacterium]|nr:TIGR03557 family F420-dependent LLM class oxidoreductase [bacterium]
MVSLGYALSSEEHGPRELVRYARLAEDSGFDFAVISDHFHPWTTHQGNAPFVWSVLGGIAMATERIPIGTAVTCPTVRYHPAIVAQAAATAAVMLPGRFMLGVGSGEALNEHITGAYWPVPSVRIQMLEEAIEIIRALWTGEEVNHDGEFYTVHQARLFTRPSQPPPLIVAATGATSARLAAQNDGMMLTAPSKEALTTFGQQGGADKPRYGQVTISWAQDDATARRNAYEWWPTGAVNGPLNSEINTPGLYDDIVKLVDEATVAKSMPCGSDPRIFLDAIQSYADAGVTHVCLHPIGPDQEGFMEFFRRELAPVVAKAA